MSIGIKKMTFTKIYVIECRARNHFYVGTTYRELYDRIKEHENQRGSIWTTRHGFKRMALWADVQTEHASTLEDELTEWLMHRYGIWNVRGGNYVNCRPDCYANDWWLPKSLQSGFRNVPGLHDCPVSKFPLEFSALSMLFMFSVVLRTTAASRAGSGSCFGAAGAYPSAGACCARAWY